MGTRELIPALPVTLRQQVNSDLGGPQLAMLDDNARFIIRRMIARAYGTGHDDGWTAGQDDARTDRRIERDTERAAAEKSA